MRAKRCTQSVPLFCQQNKENTDNKYYKSNWGTKPEVPSCEEASIGDMHEVQFYFASKIK